MYYVHVFHKDPTNGLSNVRMLRTKPFRTLEIARMAISKSGKEGYIKQVGHSVPVYHNVRTH